MSAKLAPEKACLNLCFCLKSSHPWVKRSVRAASLTPNPDRRWYGRMAAFEPKRTLAAPGGEPFLTLPE